MPNAYGALNLEEMRERVWRRINAIRLTEVDSVTGAETGPRRIDPLVSKEDLNMYLATSLTMRLIDITNASPSTFSDEKKIDVTRFQTEYALPEDMAFLRAAYWKRADVADSLEPPVERELMYEFNASSDKDAAAVLGGLHAPTYRRRLNFIVLNEVPQEDNAGGILVEYVKQLLPLVDDAQYLEMPLANMLQEVMISDAVIEIVEERMQLDASMLKVSRDTKLDRLIMAASMQKMPKSILLFVGRPDYTFAHNVPSNRRWRRS